MLTPKTIFSSRSNWMAEFIYKYLSAIVLLTFAATVFCISCLIPPFQSPDEFEHIKRAYLLTKGEIILKTKKGQSTGGEIDSGLLEYMGHYEQYPFNPSKKITADDTKAVSQIEWKNNEAFGPVYSIASYFPGLYFPQALGLLVGKKLNLTLAKSYYLSRFFAILAACILLFYSAYLFSPSPFVFAILFLSMSLYQYASASLDGVATSTFICILSIFFYTLLNREKSSGNLAVLMGFCIFLLTASRVHALPVLFLAFYSCYLTKNYKYLFAGILPAILTGFWLYFSIKNTYDSRIINTISSVEILQYYKTHIAEFFKVFFATYTNSDYLWFYVRSALGNLGWGDWPQGQFDRITYYSLGFMLLLIAYLSTSFAEIQKIKFIRIAFLSFGVMSIFIISISLLIGWTTHPAIYIEGIQGRYFHLPLLFLAYSIVNFKDISVTNKECFSYAVLFVFITFSFSITCNLILQRYY